MSAVSSSFSSQASFADNRIVTNAESWRRDAVAALDETGSVHGSPTRWDPMRTLAISDEEHVLAEAHRRMRGNCHRWWWNAQGWMLALGIGFASSITGDLIGRGVFALSSIRFGVCDNALFTTELNCPKGHWTSWGEGAGGFSISVGLATLMAALSATLVFCFAPAAAGSGIPEVKTILNGFVMSDAVSFRTLCVKAPGLVLSVAAGMSLGKEGPLVHTAVCWAQLLSRAFPQFKNDAKRREIFSAAAAAGVATAFGAPLGGVLFSLEEVSSFFPSRTLLLAFMAAVSAAFTLGVLSSRGVTMFNVTYSAPWHPIEFLGFAVLGLIGGLVGAAFNALNIRWAAFKRKPGFRKLVHPIVEVSILALLTAATSWPLALTRPQSTEAIHSLFESCDESWSSPLRIQLGLCTEDNKFEEISHGLLLSLCCAAAVRFVQMTLTFGTACPAGLFVPSLYIGACIGRFVGVCFQGMNAGGRLFNQQVQPGVYAMVGAASVLGGVCRVTISLVAIMLELTGGLTYVVPFMVAVLLAKLVGDRLNEGIYDMHIVLKGYPFLQQELDVTFEERCCDIMETRLTKVDVSRNTCLAELKHTLASTNFDGFPVVDENRFVGFIRRDFITMLVHERQVPSASQRDMQEQTSDIVVSSDLLRGTDTTVIRMVPDAPLSLAHKVFTQLGCKYIFLVGGSASDAGFDVLKGILSKKKFIACLRSGQVGHLLQQTNAARPGGAYPREDWGFQHQTPLDNSTSLQALGRPLDLNKSVDRAA